MCGYIYTYTYTRTHIHTYVYICVVEDWPQQGGPVPCALAQFFFIDKSTENNRSNQSSMISSENEVFFALIDTQDTIKYARQTQKIRSARDIYICILHIYTNT